MIDRGFSELFATIPVCDGLSGRINWWRPFPVVPVLPAALLLVLEAEPPSWK